MKKAEAISKIRKQEHALEVKRHERMKSLNLEMELETQESNLTRARSITVGTAFGGTTELLMRGNGARQLWCIMQPCEVVELIHQLAANVGCNAQITPRNDFSSWRDWRVSEAEKQHLNGHPPFVNDMAVFQQLGASGYNDEEAKRIMDIIANVKEFANENDDSKILGQTNKGAGAPSMMFGEDGLLHNKLALDEDNTIVYIAGGNGGKPKGTEDDKDAMATEKTVNKRNTKRTARTS